jgi:hypothetical protein
LLLPPEGKSMKKRIRTVLAALVSVCLFMTFGAPLLKDTRLAWINWDSLTPRHDFYFEKRIWLADARTIMSAFHYLSHSGAANPTNPMEAATVPGSFPLWSEPSTNHLGVNGSGVSSPRAAQRLSRAGRIIGRRGFPPVIGLPPMFACAEFPSIGLGVSPFPDWEMKIYVPLVRTGLLERLPQPGRLASPKLRNAHPETIETNLQGA